MSMPKKTKLSTPVGRKLDLPQKAFDILYSPQAKLKGWKDIGKVVGDQHY